MAPKTDRDGDVRLLCARLQAHTEQCDQRDESHTREFNNFREEVRSDHSGVIKNIGSLSDGIRRVHARLDTLVRTSLGAVILLLLAIVGYLADKVFSGLPPGT